MTDSTDAPRTDTEKSPRYPEEWYNLTAIGCLVLAGGCAGLALWLYPLNGEWLAGVFALLAGLLYAGMANVTVELRRVHHA